MLGFYLAWAAADLVSDVTVSVRSYVHQHCWDWRTMLLCSHPPPLEIQIDADSVSHYPWRSGLLVMCLRVTPFSVNSLPTIWSAMVSLPRKSVTQCPHGAVNGDCCTWWRLLMWQWTNGKAYRSDSVSGKCNSLQRPCPHGTGLGCSPLSSNSATWWELSAQTANLQTPPTIKVD